MWFMFEIEHSTSGEYVNNCEVVGNVSHMIVDHKPTPFVNNPASFRYRGPIIFPSLFHIGLRPIQHN